MTRSLIVLGSMIVASSLNWVSASEVATSMPVDPMPVAATSYQYDATAIKDLIGKPSSLFKVNCDSKGVLRSLGFAEGKSVLLGLSVLEGSLEYNADFRGCTLWVNNRNANWNTQESLSEAEAIKKTDEFVALLKGKVYDKVGKPIILNKNTRGGNVMYERNSMGGTVNQISPVNDVEIIDGEEEEVTREYISYTVFYPYTFNGLPVYNQRGQQAGITVDVNKNGILSANAQLLPRKASRAKSPKVTTEQVTSFVERGGNNPFYGSASSIVFKKPQRVFVLFTMPKNNSFDTYIGHGILLDSDTKLDQYSPQTYKIVISDFAIGNNW